MADIVYADLYTFSSYTWAEARATIRRKLQFDATDDTVLSDQFLLDEFNAGTRKLAVLTRAFHLSTVMGVVSGTAEYALPSDTAGRALAIENVLYSTRQLKYVTPSQLDVMYWNWKASTAYGTPYVYYQRGMSSIGLYPIPNATSGDALTVVYTAIPPNVTEDEEQFRVPIGCEDALITYVCLQSSILDSFGEGAARIAYFRDEWEREQRGAIRTVAEANKNHIIRVGGQALTMQKGFPYPVTDNFWTANPIT